MTFLGYRRIDFKCDREQTAPISMVGASREAVRLGKIIYAVLLTKTDCKALSIVHLTYRGAGAEASHCHLVPGWETWYGKWYVRGINGWPM